MPDLAHTSLEALHCYFLLSPLDVLSLLSPSELIRGSNKFVWILGSSPRMTEKK